MKLRLDCGCAWKNWMLIPAINLFIMDGVTVSFWFLCFYFSVEIEREK